MDQLAERAYVLLRRVRISRSDLALFLDGGRFRSFPVDAPECRRAQAEGMRLIGVYSADCRLEWLREDMEWAARQTRIAA